jgi:hypothetical protein
MLRGRWLRRFLAAGLVLIAGITPAGPAAAAPNPCTGPLCVRYWAEITISAWTDSVTPVLPRATHSYTVWVTNTGWRTGGASAPTPAPGPASGVVYVGLAPSSPDEVLLGHTVNVGNFISCAYYPSGLGCDIGSIPTNTTFQFTVSFRAPITLGTYTCRIFAVAFQGGSPWTEYNPDNNSTTVSYWVGYWA